MRLISHRGNISGIQTEYENRPSYIETAINLGYDVKIDIHVKDNKLFLGSTEPQYQMDIDWLEKHHTKLWLQCKDISVIEKFNMLDNRGAYLNYFWRENDSIILTSKNYLLSYNQIIKGGIAMLPENNDDDITFYYGVCSDVIQKYKKI
jgi:hypothetical protein